MNRFSLRTRLVAVAVALVAFAVLLVGAATYALLSNYLFGQLDNRLNQAAGDSAGYFRQYGASGGQVRVDRDVCTVFLSDDQIVATIQPIGEDATLDLAIARTVIAHAGPVNLRNTVGESVRAISGDVPTRNGTVQMVVSLPTEGVDNTLSRLLALELIIGVAAVAGTGALGAAGVRLGMRPLDRVTRTARTVAAELGPDGRGLANRVPDADPNTEVGQLAEAVNTMLGAVEAEYTARYESEMRMRRFLADASHELRTPLTSLRGYAELVRMRGGLDPDASDSLRRIETEGKRMGGLVEDLLTLARSDRGEPAGAERVLVDVTEVVADAAAGVRAAHHDRTVEVAPAGPLPVLGDRNQLLQVLTNVLTNAAVHATAPVPIRVAATADGDEVVVRVTDGGPGLPPEQAAQVFDRFWRADSARTRVRGGSGLGMSIVQALVADHGGTVAFDSTVEGGTTVTLRLPGAPLPSSGPEPELLSSHDGHPGTAGRPGADAPAGRAAR